MPFDGRDVDAATQLAESLSGASPQGVLAAALDAFKGRLALVSSFGVESAVLLHMAAVMDPAIPVLFLDTGQLFAQTLDYRKSLAGFLGLTNVRDLRPAFTDLAMEDPSADLWRRDPDLCCAIRKVRPLDAALDGFDAWITGRKRFQSLGRARLKAVERGGDGRIKFNPLFAMTADEVEAYARRHRLPDHPLRQGGYPSVGCWPCTKPVAVGQDLRAGRWAGLEKTECGIHRPGNETADGANVGGGI